MNDARRAYAYFLQQSLNEDPALPGRVEGLETLEVIYVKKSQTYGRSLNSTDVLGGPSSTGNLASEGVSIQTHISGRAVTTELPILSTTEALGVISLMSFPGASVLSFSDKSTFYLSRHSERARSRVAPSGPPWSTQALGLDAGYHRGCNGERSTRVLQATSLLGLSHPSML